MSRPDQPWDGSAVHQGLCPLTSKVTPRFTLEWVGEREWKWKLKENPEPGGRVRGLSGRTVSHTAGCQGTEHKTSRGLLAPIHFLKSGVFLPDYNSILIAENLGSIGSYWEKITILAAWQRGSDRSPWRPEFEPHYSVYYSSIKAGVARSLHWWCQDWRRSQTWPGLVAAAVIISPHHS